jgi:hypothetical protein
MLAIAFAKVKIWVVKWPPTVSAHCRTGTAALVWLLLLSSMQVTGAAASCYTHDEARKLWPQAHLWYHGSARCWDNAAPGRLRLLTSTSTTTTSTGTLTSAPPSDAARIEFPLTPNTTVYPELMPGSTSREMLNPASVLTWPPLINIDAADPAHFSAWNRRVSGQWGQATRRDP